MCSLVMSLFSRDYNIKMELLIIKYQQHFNLLTCVLSIHSAPGFYMVEHEYLFAHKLKSLLYSKF